MLQTTDLWAGYGKLQILRGVHLTARPGEITGIIGANGAGKSTLLKAIFGYLAPARGAITWNGTPIGGQRPDQILRRGISYVPQTRGLFPAMSVHENLLMGGYVLRNRQQLQQAIASVYEQFPLLAERRHQLAGTLSGGQQRLLEVARAMLLQPQMILLDEPSAALAPQFIDQVYDTVSRIHAQRGTGFLIVEQNVDVVLEVSHRVYALELGKNAHDGPPAEFTGNDRLRQLFLGGTQR